MPDVVNELKDAFAVAIANADNENYLGPVSIRLIKNAILEIERLRTELESANRLAAYWKAQRLEAERSVK